MKLRAFLTFSLLTLSAFAIGALWATKKSWPFEWLANHRALAAHVNRLLLPGPVINSQVSQLRLTATKAHDVKVGEHIGGGIEVYGDQVLIVTGRGEFLLYPRDKTRSIKMLDVALDNGYSAFQSYTAQHHLPAKKAAKDFRFMDIAIVGDEKSRTMLVSHHQWHDDNNCFSVRLSRLDLDVNLPLEQVVAGPDQWRTVFDAQPCLDMKNKGHPFAGSISGGRIIEDSPGSVLLSIGDHDFDGWNSDYILAQDPAGDYGKIVRVNLNTGVGTHVTVGHRNPQGLMQDGNGNIWETEHGPRGGDELNIIREGENYGWPLVTYGTRYDGWDWPLSRTQNRHNGYERPVFVWMPSIAVSNLIEVRGFLPEWEGDLLVATLGNKSLHRLRYRDSRVIFDEVIRTGYRIRDLDQSVDGSIILWTDDGQVVRLEPLTATAK